MLATEMKKFRAKCILCITYTFFVRCWDKLPGMNLEWKRRKHLPRRYEMEKPFGSECGAGTWKNNFVPTPNLLCPGLGPAPP